MFQFIADRWSQIWFSSWQHFSLVVQCTVLAAVIAVLIAALVYRSPRFSALANGVSAIGLTIPSFALIGMLIVPFRFGVVPSVITLVFFGALPILRNAVVGLAEISPSIVESARGIGMGRVRTFLQIELPMAWPIILAGIRQSAQMLMGIAAVAAYALGPGLGSFIFSGLSRLGGANAIESVAVGVIGVIILALILDLLLAGLGRLTIPRGIRVQH